MKQKIAVKGVKNQKIIPSLGFNDKADEAAKFYVSVFNCHIVRGGLCAQNEVDWFWEKLSQGGEKSQCGWLKDKYGLSWQVVPTVILKFMSGADPAKSQGVMSAVLKMGKLE